VQRSWLTLLSKAIVGAEPMLALRSQSMKPRQGSSPGMTI
jgi:hypothetical protein